MGASWEGQNELAVHLFRRHDETRLRKQTDDAGYGGAFLKDAAHDDRNQSVIDID